MLAQGLFISNYRFGGFLLVLPLLVRANAYAVIIKLITVSNKIKNLPFETLSLIEFPATLNNLFVPW